jgi:predicted RNase H-like nuclease (RuvC/YqgF family)
MTTPAEQIEWLQGYSASLEAANRELVSKIERLRAALERIANRFEDAKSPYTVEGQTREEARAALKSN